MQIDKNSRIAITGAFGFIGANTIRYLNRLGYTNIDVYETPNWQKKWKNTIGLKHNPIIYTNIDNLTKEICNYQVVIHLAANSSTQAEPNEENWKTNYIDTINIIDAAPLTTKVIFASSASTYGLEEKDFTERVDGLKPICFYAYTKWKCDEYILNRSKPNVYGLKFFNVFGSHLEQYKGGMSSVIYRWLTQPIENVYGPGKHAPIELFKSLRPEYGDGLQARDFIYWEDICSIIVHCMETDAPGGLYNAGTGYAATWLEVAKTVLKVRGLDEGLIKFIDMPEKLRDQYQYFTQASTDKLRNQLGYTKEFTPLTEAIKRTYAEIQGK